MSNTEALAPRLARTISKAAREAGLSQRNIADELGLSINTIGRRLRGESPFDLDEVEAIASLIHRTTLDLIADAEKVAA